MLASDNLQRRPLFCLLQVQPYGRDSSHRWCWRLDKWVSSNPRKISDVNNHNISSILYCLSQDSGHSDVQLMYSVRPEVVVAWSGATSLQYCLTRSRAVCAGRNVLGALLLLLSAMRMRPSSSPANQACTCNGNDCRVSWSHRPSPEEQRTLESYNFLSKRGPAVFRIWPYSYHGRAHRDAGCTSDCPPPTRPLPHSDD